jgi:hypothetical protein
MILRRFVVTLAALAGLSSSPAYCVDGFAAEIGNGESVDMGRISVQWDWNRRLLQWSDWHLGGYWDLAAGYWRRGSVAAGENRDLYDLGFTPVFRIQPNGLAGPYAELAVGFHLLSETSIGDKHMSTNFQFGDHVGVGYRFGTKQAYDLSYRFQHLSNAGIKNPNPGINFHQIRLQYHF